MNSRVHPIDNTKHACDKADPPSDNGVEASISNEEPSHDAIRARHNDTEAKLGRISSPPQRREVQPQRSAASHLRR